MKGSHLFAKSAIALLAVSAAAKSDAAFAIITLDSPHKVVGQASQSIWYSGSILITQDFNSATLFVEHAFLEGTYAHRLDVNSYANSFYQWLGTNASHFAGASYTGDLFELTQEASDPIGFYNHHGVSINTQPVAYMYFNGNNDPSHRSTENHFTVQVVPEPATMAVLGLGVLPLLRRRRKANS